MKLAIFDLDGVLVNTTEIHTAALRRAVAYVIDGKAHQEPYLDAADGIRTRDKLARLADSYDLTDIAVDCLDHLKNKIVTQQLSLLKPNQEIIDGIKALRQRGYKVAVASNSRRSSVDTVLEQIGLTGLVNFSISGDEVDLPKPDPEIFIKTIQYFDVSYFPQCAMDLNEVYIFEDSPAGLEAARNSGARVIQVDPSKLVTVEQLLLCK
jgi:beta-phosphoglucomutase